MQITDLGHGRGWLDAPAAASIHRIDAQLGRPLQITDAGRTWDEQMEDYQAYLDGVGAYALHPDTPSRHQVGDAADSDESMSLGALLEEHGWVLAVYDEDGNLLEWWHREYRPDLDQHLHAPIPAAPAAPSPEEDEMPLSLINVVGREGVRRGGTYAIMRSNPAGGSVLFARFIQPEHTPGVPTLSEAAVLEEWDATLPGLQ